MKTQKLLVIVALVCLLVGASSVALAQDTCEGYYIEGKTFESLTLTGQSCFLVNVTITGDLTVTNAGKFNLQNSDVGGIIRVETSEDVSITDSMATGVILRNNTAVNVQLITAKQAIRVIRNGTA
jgi:hypothetical protein